MTYLDYPAKRPTAPGYLGMKYYRVTGWKSTTRISTVRCATQGMERRQFHVLAQQGSGILNEVYGRRPIMAARMTPSF